MAPKAQLYIICDAYNIQYIKAYITYDDYIFLLVLLRTLLIIYLFLLLDFVVKQLLEGFTTILFF